MTGPDFQNFLKKIIADFCERFYPCRLRCFSSPPRLPPCGVLRCMGRSAERRTAPCGFQIPCSPCPGLRRSGGTRRGERGIGGQPVLEVSVVCADIDQRLFLVKPYCSCLAFRFNRLCICSNSLSAYSDICSHKNTCPVRNTPDN